MNAIQLESSQIKRKGKYPAPNIPNYNSLFFHPLTKHGNSKELENWGYELTVICNNEGITYFYFYNDFNKKINVYPNETIEKWWSNR